MDGLYPVLLQEEGILCAPHDSIPKGEPVSAESAVVLCTCSIGTLPSAGMECYVGVDGVLLSLSSVTFSQPSLDRLLDASDGT